MEPVARKLLADVTDLRRKVSTLELDASFDAVRAALDKRDAILATQIHSRFEAADQSLAPYRSGTGYVPYNQLTDADTRKLAQAIDALAEPLSQVGGKLAGS
jgi:iron uptake system component EfeO